MVVTTIRLQAAGRHNHAPRVTAPPGARLMQLRMFYIPDESAEVEETGQ